MDILIMAGQLMLSLSILIVLHEMGHFLPARLFGTRVEKFYLFFDPWFSLLKKKVGDMLNKKVKLKAKIKKKEGAKITLMTYIVSVKPVK